MQTVTVDQFKTARPWFLIPLLVAAILIFIWGARQQSLLVNIDMESTDQSAYMDYAKNIAETNFQFVGGRNRMPLYPALMSFFYTDGVTNDDFFVLGKNVGIMIALLGLVIIYFILNQVSSHLDALTGTLVTAFTVFAYKAPYFQTEILFYVIGLLLFYLLARLVKKPTLKTAILAGIIGGIGHLTKASVMPSLILAMAVVIIKTLIVAWQTWRQRDVEVNSENLAFVWKNSIYLVLLLGCFLLVVFPYIHTSKERFGHYFYNVNSTFYIWYDSWAEATQGTKAHGDRVGWPDMPPEEIPSLQKYLREHTTAQIFGRFTTGYQTIYNKVIESYGYAQFLLFYFIASAWLLIQNKKLRSLLDPWLVLFGCGYFIGHSLLFAWYAPIASGNRFILSLFLPAMLIVSWLFSAAQNHQFKLKAFGRPLPASAISPIALLILLSYLLTIFPQRIATMYGGS